jgi:hypothetical protein
MKLTVCMPDETERKITLPTMPRVGEHLAFDGTEFAIIEVSYEFTGEVLTEVSLIVETPSSD